MTEFCQEANSIDTIFSFNYVKFDTLYQLARFFTNNTETDIDIPLRSYGSISRPYRAFFGVVDGEHVASWVQQYGTSLFEQNVRFTLQSSDVNEAIFETVRADPEKFWYFNNGITTIASEASPTPTDADPRIIKTKSLSIVNGAQTAGMLARAAEEGLDLSAVKVQFRVISLSGASPGLDEEVTRANNTQNELNALDFVSLDPRQDLLRTELAGLGYDYILKRGSEISGSLPRIEVKEAAVALACANDDIAISVQAKRYVSGLWSNIKSPPYTKIFDEKITGRKLLDVYLAYRACESAMRALKADMDKEDNLILTHGDRFVAHCVFQILKDDNKSMKSPEKVKDTAKEIAMRLVEDYKKSVVTYPATAFKNQKTQEALRLRLIGK